MYYEVQLWYAKAGGPARWYPAYYANDVRVEGQFLRIREGEGEVVYLPATRPYRVVEVEEP